MFNKLKRINPIKPFCDCIVNLSFDKEQYNKTVKSKSSDETILAHFGENGKAVWLENKKNGSPYFIIGIFFDNIEIVSHEASHITTHIMDYLGIKDDEFRAYMVGYITKEICNRLYKETING